MTLLNTIALVKDIVTLLTVVIGAVVVLFVYFQFAPVLSLRISPTWVDNQKELLLVRFELENKARVRLHNPKGRIQVLEYWCSIKRLIITVGAV